MKLLTLIKPRNDGTVRVTLDGNNYVFAPEAKGAALTAEVENEDHIVRLLLTEQFEPADESDHEAAEALLSQVAGGDDDQGDDDQGDDQDESNPNAPPIEAHTPPKAPKAPAGARKKQAQPA